MLINPYILNSAPPPPVSAFMYTWTGDDMTGNQLPLTNSGTYDMYVDWGDGSPVDHITAYNQAEATHIYPDTNPYQVSITGTCTHWDFTSYTTSAERVLTVDQWGDIGVTSGSGCFSGCINLTTIPAGFWAVSDSLDGLFYNCYSLNSLPVGLFANVTGTLSCYLTFFSNAFTEIPADLFSTFAPNNLDNTFAYCSVLASLPANLFNNLGAGINMTGVCYGCNALTTLPVGLMDGTTPMSLETAFAYSGVTVSNAADWDVTGLLFAANLFAGCTLDVADYESLLVGWGNQSLLYAVSVDFGLSLHNRGTAADVGYHLLGIAGWGITSGGTFDFTPLITTWETTAPSELIHLPIASDPSLAFAIDWGDGDVQSGLTDADYPFEHTYAVAGTYTITITGEVPSWNFALESTSATKIRTVEQWGYTGSLMEQAYWGCSGLTSVALGAPSASSYQKTFRDCVALTTTPYHLFTAAPSITDMIECFSGSGLTTTPVILHPSVFDMSGTFSYCVDLASIDPATFGNCTNLNYMYETFRGCTSLTEIPAGVFTTCGSLVDISGAFADCTALTTIGLNAFDGMTTISTANELFLFNSSLTAIPADLMSNAFTLTSAASMFKDCSSIAGVPSGLFASCSSLDNVSSIFENCGLTVLPDDLWAYSPNITNAYGAFFNNSITEVPLNMFGAVGSLANITSIFYGNGVTDAPDVASWPMANLTDGADAFSGCTINTTDYDAILLGWLATGPVNGYVTVDFGLSQYTAGGAVEAARDDLINIHNWTILDGGPV